MKRFACVLTFATFTAVASGYGQSATDQAVAEMSGIHRPTPKPGASPASTAATGPMEAGLYKDTKGKDAATTFGPGDTVFLVAKNVTAAKGDKLSVAWYFDGKGGKSKKISGGDSPVPSAGVYNPTYNLQPGKPSSTAGSYHVEFSQNGKVVKRLAFTVK